MQQPCTCIMSC